MRNVPWKYFVYASSASFRNFIYRVLKWGTIYVNYILLWLFMDELFQEQTITITAFNGKRYETMFLVWLWLLLWQRQVCGNISHSHAISIMLSSQYNL